MPQANQAMQRDFTAASQSLARCDCGSKSVLRYEPGCTYVVCLAERETKLALPEWQPREAAKEWNNKK